MRCGASHDFGRDQSGISAVEFALACPIILLILLGGYALGEGITISRKVTITTRALADLTSQYASVSSLDLSTIMSASTQIIAPFGAAPLSMRLSEISTDPTGLKATVTWSTATNMTPYQQNATFVLPPTMYVPNTSFVFSEVTYTYVPPVVYGISGPFQISDSLYMLPRVSNSVVYTGS